MNYLEEFKNRLLYRKIGRFFVFLDVVFVLTMILFEVPISIMIIFIGLFIGITVLFSRAYACPKCEKTFDVFKNIDEYEYCPFCGEHIYIIENEEEV